MDDINFPWLENVWRVWNQLPLTSNRLLIGLQGIGKASLVKRYIGTLVCQQKKDCKQCPTCLWFAGGVHPDVFWLNEAGRIGIDVVRGINDFLLSSATLLSVKVVVVPNAERLTLAASQTLLKILEEPAVPMAAILFATSLYSIPETLQSRCQIIPIAAPSEEETLAWLISSGKGNLTDAKAALLATGGAPLLAYEALLDPNTKKYKAFVALSAWSKGQGSLNALQALLPLEEWLVVIPAWIRAQVREEGHPEPTEKTFSQNSLSINEVYRAWLVIRDANFRIPGLNLKLMLNHFFMTLQEVFCERTGTS